MKFIFINLHVYILLHHYLGAKFTLQIIILIIMFYMCIHNHIIIYRKACISRFSIITQSRLFSYFFLRIKQLLCVTYLTAIGNSQ